VFCSNYNHNEQRSELGAWDKRTDGLENRITPLLADLHWLRIPQRIHYKLCVLVYQCVQGSALSYLQNTICPVASAESRRRLRYVSSADLIVPATRCTTMGAGPRLRRRSTARLEQSAGRDPSQPIAGCLQTLSENLLLYPVFLFTLFLSLLNPTSLHYKVPLK